MARKGGGGRSTSALGPAELR